MSSSSKSTLVNDILAKELSARLPNARVPGAHDVIEINHLDKVIVIDQSAIGRTPRSNPATYTGVFTAIRELFAERPKRFVHAGIKRAVLALTLRAIRCENCQGDGVIQN